MLIKELRGEAIGTISSQSSSEEVFQNQVLRPILKLQNELILAVFVNYIDKNKRDFYSLSVEKKIHSIENSIQKDSKLKNILKGIIISFFTLDEFQMYSQNSSNTNKRMISMLIERLKSQIQLLDKQD